MKYPRKKLTQVSDTSVVYYCPCGDRLWTREQLLAEDDGMSKYVATMLTADDAYCDNEDDVVPRAYWLQKGKPSDPAHRW